MLYQFTKALHVEIFSKPLAADRCVLLHVALNKNFVQDKVRKKLFESIGTKLFSTIFTRRELFSGKGKIALPS